MKNLPGTLKYIGLFVGLTALLACLTYAAGDKPAAGGGKVAFKGDTEVVIHPWTKISPADQKALNAILKQYDKSVYRIETVKNGKRRTKGELGTVFLDQATVAEVEQAQTTGRDSKAIQIIGLSGPSVFLSPNAGATTSVNKNGPGPKPISPSNVSATMKTGPTATPSSVSKSTGPAPSPTSVNQPPREPSTSSINKPPKVTEKQAEELVEKIKPILEKYSK